MNRNNKADWEIRIIGKCGMTATIKRINVTIERNPLCIRKAMAAYWAIVKKGLTDGQSATITLNDRITRTFNA